MLTAEENEMLTRVGPGTPAGELLRRYWHPVAIAADLTPESPTKFVRILGENLVLFVTPKGEPGLLHDRCSHRGASLSYGRVEERGLACAYHGWLYDPKGNCLETPAEPADSKFCLTVKHKAYPVQKLAGLYWAYFGPQPAPVIPKYDVWARTDGWHWLRALPQLDCNWLQAMENSVDTAHLHILHQELVTDGFKVESTTRGTIDNLVKYEMEEFTHGIIKRRVFRDGKVEEHPLLFPTVLRQANRTQIRVPIDDTHTWIVYVATSQQPGKVLECNLDASHWKEPGKLAEDGFVFYRVIIANENSEGATHVWVNAVDGSIIKTEKELPRKRMP